MITINMESMSAGGYRITGRVDGRSVSERESETLVNALPALNEVMGETAPSHHLGGDRYDTNHVRLNHLAIRVYDAHIDEAPEQIGTCNPYLD